jgi:DNA modification methylase
LRGAHRIAAPPQLREKQVALTFETWPIERCVEYIRNPRKNDHAVDKVAAAIREFGFRVPICAKSDGTVVDGHLRLKAAKKLGLKEVPVVLADDMSEAQIKAFRLSVNKVAELAQWDTELLALEFTELEDMGFDLSLTGFEADEIGALFPEEAKEGLTDDDAVPDAPAVPVTREGDVWLLGRHRLMCGDSTSIDAVERLMAGQRADLCFTSPPYAQQRDYKKEISDWDGLMNGVFSACPVKDGAQILVNLGLVHEKGRVNSYWDAWIEFMDANGWPLFGWYVWDQGFGLPGNWNGRLAPSHEFVFHFSKGGNNPANKWVEKKAENIKARNDGASTMRGKDGKTKKFTNPGASSQATKVSDSVIRVNRQVGRVTKDGDHPAVFPVALCEHIYKSYAKAGDWMFEPFSGSGTSIIACEKMDMNCAAMELAPEYTDIAVKRWQDWTGQEATLEATGQTFAELSAEREAA